jgi:hypothetical protein
VPAPRKTEAMPVPAAAELEPLVAHCSAEMRAVGALDRDAQPGPYAAAAAKLEHAIVVAVVAATGDTRRRVQDCLAEQVDQAADLLCHRDDPEAELVDLLLDLVTDLEQEHATEVEHWAAGLRASNAYDLHKLRLADAAIHYDQAREQLIAACALHSVRP